MLADIPFYVRNDFTNLTEIGHGGGGRIYKGELEDFGQIVVKEFFWSDQQSLEEYKREVEILVKHNHPNIVQLYGILWNGSDSSRYLGYVMEFVEGGSLHDVIYDRNKNYDTAQICRWVKQIALGLQFLHKKQIIHRDIKPANILVAGSQLKLADFGIARDVDVSLTTRAGTYSYMAPEVITTRRYGPAADIYSLAITIWELFHRIKPYTALEGNDVAINLQIDENTARFIQRCWHTIVADRPSLKEIIEYFGSKADSSVVPVDPAPSFDPPGPVNVRGRPMVSCDSNLTILVLGGIECGRETDERVILKEDKWIKLALKLPKILEAGGAVYLDGEIYIFGGISMAKELYKLDNKTLEWIRLADMNQGREGISNSSVEWNGSIWVFGGWNAVRSELKSVERYDPKKNKWINMQGMKDWRISAAAAVHNGKFIVCGGYDGSNYLTSVECFDPESGVWTEMNDMPTPLHSHSLVSYGNNLILMTIFNTVLELSNLEGKGTWKELPPMKQRRRHFSATVLDNEIFVIGGYETDKTEIFNGKSWRDGPFLPHVCVEMSSIVIPRHLADILGQVDKGTILVLGGIECGRGSDEMVILKQDRWNKLALKLPEELNAAGAVYLDGEIYVFGGSMAKELYKLDNKTLEWIRLADMNQGRAGISNSSVEWNGSIWVFGGWKLKSVERYDPKKNKWIEMPDMKDWRISAAAAVHNGKFIVCGGRDDSNRLKSVECFDPESGVWTELNDMPTPLCWHSLVPYGNNLILMGGWEGKTDINTVLEVSNLEGKGTWKELPPMKQPRRAFSAAVLDNEIFVIGGSNGTDKTEIFNGKSWRQGPQLPNGCSSMSSIVIPFRLAHILSNSTE